MPNQPADGPDGHYFDSITSKLTRASRFELFKDSAELPDNAISVERSLDTQVIVGTVPSVVDQTPVLRDQLGSFSALLYTGPAGAMPHSANALWS